MADLGEGEWALEETQLKILEALADLVVDSTADKKTLNRIDGNIKKSVTTDKKAIEHFNDMVSLGEQHKEKRNKNRIEDTKKKPVGIAPGATKAGISLGKDKDLSDNDAFKNLNRASTGFGRMLGTISPTLGRFGDFATDTVKSLFDLNNGFKNIAKSLWIIGPALGFLVGWIGNTIDSFREMQMVGLTFGGSMFKLAEMAGSAGIDLGTFSKVVKANSQLMKGIGGPQVLADTVKGISEEVSKLGYSMESLTEFSADNLDQLKVSGAFEHMSNRQRIASTARYVRELNNMSELTGISAKQLSEEQKKAARNTRILAAGLGLTGQAAIDYDQNVKRLSLSTQRFGAGFAKSVIDMSAHAKQFGGNFAGTGPLGGMIATMNGVGPAMQDVVDAFASGDDIEGAVNRLGLAMGNLTDVEESQIQLRGQINDAEAAVLLDAIAANKMFNQVRQKEIDQLARYLAGKKEDEQLTQRERDAAKDDLARQKETTTQFLQVQQQLQLGFGQMKAHIIDGLVEAGVFKALGEATSHLTKLFETHGPAIGKFIGEMLISIKEFGGRFMKAFDKFFNALTPKGEKKFNIFEVVWKSINEAFLPDNTDPNYNIFDKIMESVPWGTIATKLFGALVTAIVAAMLAVKIGALLMTFVVVPLMSGLGSLLLGALGALFAGIAAILAAPLLVIVAGIAAGIAGFVALFYFWDDIIGPVEDGLNWVGDQFVAFADWLRDLGIPLPTWEEIKAKMPPWLVDTANWIGDFLSGLIPGKEKLDTAKENAKNMVKGVSGLWNKMFGDDDEGGKPVANATVKAGTGARGIQNQSISINTAEAAATMVAATESQAVASENTIIHLEKLLEESMKQNAILMNIAESNAKTAKLNNDLLTKVSRAGRLN